jgi:hypothetical protein
MDRRSEKLINLMGKTFGRLTVIGRADDYVLESGCMQVNWVCRCVCGNEKAVRSSRLRSGVTKSCGCIRRERAHTLNAIRYAKNAIQQARKRPAE